MTELESSVVVLNDAPTIAESRIFGVDDHTTVFTPLGDAPLDQSVAAEPAADAAEPVQIPETVQQPEIEAVQQPEIEAVQQPEIEAETVQKPETETVQYGQDHKPETVQHDQDQDQDQNQKPNILKIALVAGAIVAGIAGIFVARHYLSTHADVSDKINHVARVVANDISVRVANIFRQ